MALPVGLQLYSVRDDMEKDPLGTLRKIKEMGYDGIEDCGYASKDPEGFRSTCEEIGLRIISAHGGDEVIIDKIEETVELYKKLGTEYLVLAYTGEDNYPTGENYKKHSEGLASSCDYAAKHGIQVLFHNHEGELTPWGDTTVLEGIIMGTDGKLWYEPDVCWLRVAGRDPVEFLSDHTGKCPIVHIKDFYAPSDFVPDRNAPVRPEGFEFRPAGYGRQDLPAVLDAAEKCGAHWVVVEQDSPSLGKSAMECAALSCSWLKTERG